MSVLFIRRHSRFAVCREAWLQASNKRRTAGLLIEVSLGGCRLSGIAADACAIDEQVTLRVEGAERISGRVRWIGDAGVGLRFDKPLASGALKHLIRICRNGPADQRDQAKVA